MPKSKSNHFSQLEQRLIEACDELWDGFVDPREPFYDGDADGMRWLALSDGAQEHSTGAAVSTEQELRAIRAQCRTLAATNEFAINGHENRVSYIIGSGHTYRAVVKKHQAAPPLLAADVQAVLEEFIAANQWHKRQQEIVRRKDRDGEAFLRFFDAADGTLRVRFVEPGLVSTPVEWAGVPAASFGVLSEADDVESVRAYFIEGQRVDAAEIQHRKANVDSNVKRGLPLFYPVYKNLKRAEKLLRNMSVLAEIQSAIALIRKHHRGTRAGVQQFVSDQADATVSNSTTGRTTTFRRFAPGTILDAFGNIDYDFPAAAVNAASYVSVLQAELRAIASRLVMPEFMLTSDASNANYASTLVAEGPALKFFERLQAEQIAEDLEVMWRVVNSAIAAGRLPREAFSQIDIQASPPSLAVRDHLKEAQVYKIEHAAGILSPQTWSQLRGLDYDQEQANLGSHGARPNASN
jgi:capsid protein